LNPNKVFVTQTPRLTRQITRQLAAAQPTTSADKQCGDTRWIRKHIVNYALGIGDIDSLANEGYLSIEGINIQFIFDEMFFNDRILCVCEIGIIKEELKEKILESLLMLNFLTGSKTTGVFAVDPITQCASFVVTLINPENLSADQLADLLRCYISRNLFLQKTLFMSGELSLPIDCDNSEFDNLSKNWQLA
jgi:hypothetical protein